MNFSIVTSKIKEITVKNKRLLSTIALVLCIFAWTNWYFSAPKQFERFAEKVAYQVFTRDMLDSALKELPDTTTGGSGEIDINCVVKTCSVTKEIIFYTNILKDNAPDNRVISYSVSAVFIPQIQFFEQSQLLPQKIVWAESRWLWAVTIRYPADRSKNIYFRGDLAELNKVPVSDGNLFYNQLSAIGANMHRSAAREINRLNEIAPISRTP